MRYSKRCCKFGWIGYKCSVPGTNLVIKDASNLGERFTFKFGGSHPRGEQEDVTTDKENNKNKIKQNILIFK